MKRTRALRLVLLGGGVATMLAACGDNRQEECERARAELRPDAERICQRSTSRSSSGSSWSSGKSGGGSSYDSTRGGFGSAHASSGG